MLRWLIVVVALSVTACTAAPSTPLDDVVAAEATPQSAGLVDLTVYFRHGRGEEAYLTPVKHEVPVSEDLPKVALQLLLDGPSSDADGLLPPLPASTKINRFEVTDQTATIDVTRDIVADAGTVGTRPEHEYLALASLANTLTEFPAISRVALTIDGKSGGRFWGGWGLPEYLVRDEDVVDPVAPGRVVPDVERFSRAPQRLGGVRGTTPVITSIRARPRVGYLRVTLELAMSDGDPLVGVLPRTRAKRQNGAVELAIAAQPDRGVVGDLATTFDDPTFTRASVGRRGQPHRVLVRVAPVSAGGFSLHSSTDPTRVILDIRR